MNININEQNGTLNVVLEGRMDSKESPAVEEAIKEKITEETEKIELDVTGVDYVSSSGLRVLISLYKMLKSKNIIIINPNASVEEVLKLSGLAKFFKIETR